MNEEFVQALLKESEIIQGKRRLPCAKAFQLAGRFRLTIKEVGQACEAKGIKISSCQLGCF